MQFARLVFKNWCLLEKQFADSNGVFRRLHYSTLSKSKKPRLLTMKIETPEFKSLFTPDLLNLVACFSRHNYEIRIAGGAVRDILLGQLPKDVDFATPATPDEMRDMFNSENIRMINTKGELHGTVTARINESNFEVTTLRIDVVTDGRHAKVEFTTDWCLDASRRDLTVNSMFLGIDGTLFDYFGGYKDLIERRVVFVGDAEERIMEDYLRILRYFRFYGRIAKEPDKHEPFVIDSIKKHVGGLSKISGERIWMELSKILRGNFAGHLLAALVEVNAGPYIGFPKTPNVACMQTIYSKSHSLELHPVTLLVSLFETSEEFIDFTARCRLSNFERDLGLFVLKHRNIDKKPDELKPFQMLYFYSECKPQDTRTYISELLKYNCDLKLLESFRSWEPVKFPINGHILIQHGVPPGKTVGKVMKGLKDYWIEHNFSPSQSELLEELPGVLKKLNVQKVNKK